MEVQPLKIQLYLLEDQSSPFETWLDSLRDRDGKSRVRLRLRRILLGNLGDYKSLGDGVYEFRIKTGPGYRVYFGIVGNSIILLLCGGDKGSQDRDILKAKEYWSRYENNSNADGP